MRKQQEINADLDRIKPPRHLKVYKLILDGGIRDARRRTNVFEENTISAYVSMIYRQSRRLPLYSDLFLTAFLAVFERLKQFENQLRRCPEVAKCFL